jgi:hypothetical protein
MLIKTVVTAFVLTAIALMVYPVNVAESEEFVTRDLIGYWTMDRADINGQIVRDISGNNNHGEISGNPQIVPGKIGEALDFDGVDDFVALPDLGHEPKVTVEVWARGDQSFRVHGLVSTSVIPEEMPGGVTFTVRFNRIDLNIKDKGGYRNLTGGTVKPYTWYHFAYTFDAKELVHEQLTLHINGGEGNRRFDALGALPNVEASPINLTRLRIGSELKGRYFPGILDEGRIYNRALTPDEIRQNFEYRNNARVVDARRKLAVTWGVLKTTKH